MGASAGGLEALEGLFRAMPADTGAAFVVIQHLSPDFESRMDELLSRQTPIAIEQVTDGVEVKPNTIYLVPPRKETILSGGKLLLTDQDPDRGFSLPIDRFFRSLAQDAGPLSIGIVLSGTGSDGSRGVRDIHEAGGIVLAQTEESAKFDGMPRSAIATGVVDLELEPAEMPDSLVKYFERSHTVEELGRRGGSGMPDTVLGRIFHTLRREFGIDFGHYKPTTVARRIDRRLPMTDCRNLEEYADYLVANPEEVTQLYKDLLIGVTRFFRDEEAFGVLEKNVVAPIVEGADPAEGIRVWDAGCATGEEAYSLAILFHEACERLGRRPELKIFATDVHAASLERASQGVYRIDALEGVSHERMARFFKKEGELYHVAPELRKSIVFARHNVVHDAPFTRMDLVICRNLLIYLQPGAQKKVLSLFHFGLKTNGVLFMGPSETPGELTEEFEVEDKKWRIYRKTRDVRLPTDLRMPLSTPSTAPMTRRRFDGLAGNLPERRVLPIYDRILDRFMPPGFLVSDHFELLHTFGGAERFLRVRGGRPTQSIVDLVQEELKTSLLGALQHVEKDARAVRYTGVTVPRGEPGQEELEELRLSVEPLEDNRGNTTHYVIAVESVGVHAGSDAPETEVDVEQVSRDYIDSLEAELRFTKENLQATVEELQTSNEELQATNEELVASNEELQSTNEELHSVNEELYTVNSEHQRKIDELTELTADMDNLLHSTDIGVVFLDRELRIRKYTSRTTDIFRLLPQDVGRGFHAFVHAVEDPGLMEAVARVLEDEHAIDREIRTRSGDHYYMRILPYRAKMNVEGVVLTFVDISSLKAKEADIRRLSSIVESSRDAIVATDLSGKVIAWNDGAKELYGYTAGEALGQSLYELIVPAEKAEELDAIFERAKMGKKLEYLETVRRRKSGSLVNVSLGVSPIFDERDVIVGTSAIDRDITDRLRVEQQMREAVQQRERFLAMLSHELRNPLAAMINAASLMGDGASDEILDKARATMVRQARHMARLLDDLLDVSRMRQDRIEMRKELMDLRETVDDVLESVRSYADEVSVTVATDLSARPLVVNADPTRMRQIQVNLITNAIKYSKADTTVTLRMYEEQGEAILCVVDEGRGIDPSMLTSIFQPFVREGEHEDHETEGMGLGLALVESIVRAHDGEVSAFSEGAGCGSEFTVRLPLATERPSKQPKQKKRMQLGGKTVLLVEDQEDNRMLLEALLRRRGYDVWAAGDGAAALDMVDGRAPDVALIDIGLPGMTGLEVAQRLRERPDGGAMYLIALTGYGQQSDRDKVLAAGFDQHLVKPVESDVLLEVLSDPPERLREP